MKLEKFIEYVLPTFSPAVIKEAKVMIITYNSVLEFSKGIQKIGKLSLNIMSALSIEEDLENCYRLNTERKKGAFIAEAQHQIAQRAVEQKKLDTKILSVETPDIICMYAGVSAYKEAVKSALQAHEKWPKAYIAIVTCECNLNEKLNELLPLKEREVIDTIIAVPECGGHHALSQIARAFVKMYS